MRLNHIGQGYYHLTRQQAAELTRGQLPAFGRERHVAKLDGITLLHGLREMQATDEGNAGWVTCVMRKGRVVFALTVHNELRFF